MIAEQFAVEKELGPATHSIITRAALSFTVPGSAGPGGTMPRSVMSRRARLRADALLDSWARSLVHIGAVTPGHPVVPPADESQALLEGAVFDALDVLHFSTEDERIRSLRLPGMLEVTRIQAEPDRLLLDVAPHGVALTLASALFPWHEAGPNSPIHAAGMRLRPMSHGVEVHRPGRPGSVQIRGVGLDEVMDEHRTYCPDGRCFAELSPRAITRAEIDVGFGPSREAAAALSAVVRRLGILRRAGAYSIDSWTALVSPRGTIAVEALFPRLDRALRASIIADLASEHLSPQWAIEPWLGRTGEPIESYFHLRSPGTHSDIQLRLVGPIEGGKG